MNRIRNNMKARKPASSRSRASSKREGAGLKKTLVADLSKQNPLVELSSVNLVGDTQPRQNMSPGTVEDYAQEMVFDEEARAVVDHAGQKWPEIVVFRDGADLWLADGFHRVHAAGICGIERFQADVREGGQREAIRHSLGVNKNHGLRRTKKDKRRVVERALGDPDWQRMTDSRIAQMCSVTNSFVSKLRKELEGAGEIPRLDQLFKTNGDPVDREPAPLKPPSLATHTAPLEPRERPGTASAPTGAPTESSWMELSSLDLEHVDALVAYPQTRAHWEQLAGVCRKANTSGFTLITPFYRGSAWSYRGPMYLDELVEQELLASPVPVRLASGQRVFWVWSTRASQLDDHVERPRDLLAHASNHVVVGKSIDAWGD